MENENNYELRTTMARNAAGEPPSPVRPFGTPPSATENRQPTTPPYREPALYSYAEPKSPEQANRYAYTPPNVGYNAPQSSGYSAQPQYHQNYNYGATPPRPRRPKSTATGWIITSIVLAAVLICTVTAGVLYAFTNGEPGNILPGSLPTNTETAEPDTVPTPIPTIEPGERPSVLPEMGGALPEITNYNNPIVDLNKQVLPSVVGVSLNFDQRGEQVVIQRGSGFIISAEGYVVTNHHVVYLEPENSRGISGDMYYEVTFSDGKSVSAVLVGEDATMDVAVVKVVAPNLKPAALGNSDKTEVGELAIAIGNPAGAGENLQNTLTVGYVSAVNQKIVFNGTKQSFIQTDAAINSGNSGGPLFNIKGEVIGITTFKSLTSSATSAMPTEGLGFAIPINNAMKSVEQIIKFGSIKKPGIGINYQMVMADEEAGTPFGARVETLMTGSTAEQAGIKVGDIITKYNGNDVTTKETLADAVAAKQIGESITFTVFRNGKHLDITVKIGDINSMR